MNDVILVSVMPTEILHIKLSSVVPVALVLGGINGLFVSLPIIWHWIDTMQWITGVEMGVGMFALGVGISILATAITTAIVVVILVWAYNLIASQYGGVEVILKT